MHITLTGRGEYEVVLWLYTHLAYFCIKVSMMLHDVHAKTSKSDLAFSSWLVCKKNKTKQEIKKKNKTKQNKTKNKTKKKKKKRLPHHWYNRQQMNRLFLVSW